MRVPFGELEKDHVGKLRERAPEPADRRYPLFGSPFGTFRFWVSMEAHEIRSSWGPRWDNIHISLSSLSPQTLNPKP